MNITDKNVDVLAAFKQAAFSIAPSVLFISFTGK